MSNLFGEYYIEVIIDSVVFLQSEKKAVHISELYTCLPMCVGIGASSDTYVCILV